MILIIIQIAGADEMSNDIREKLQRELETVQEAMRTELQEEENYVPNPKKRRAEKVINY